MMHRNAKQKGAPSKPGSVATEMDFSHIASDTKKWDGRNQQRHAQDNVRVKVVKNHEHSDTTAGKTTAHENAGN